MEKYPCIREINYQTYQFRGSKNIKIECDATPDSITYYIKLGELCFLTKQKWMRSFIGRKRIDL